MYREAGNFNIQDVVECLYLNGDLHQSRSTIGELVLVCDIKYGFAGQVSYFTTQRRNVTY